MSNGVVGSAGGAAVETLFNPKSVVVVGISSKPGTAGHTVVGNLKANNFKGDIYLIGRSGGEIDGRKVFTSFDELPEGVELAIFTLPAAGVKEAVISCVARKVKVAVIFAAGFAEMGEHLRGEQDAITQIARNGGLRLLGPNCLGYSNNVNPFSAGFAGVRPVTKVDPKGPPALAIVSQSGGLMGHLQSAFTYRNLQVSYTMSSGNEADLGLADFIDYLADDELTKAIVLYVEDVRDPAAFLAAAEKARQKNKPIVMYHPGRSERAQAATASHTGALAADYKVMKMNVERAGVAFVETLEDWADMAELLARFPVAPTKGAGVLTFSGAFCAIAHDYFGDLGIDIPELSPDVQARLQKRLPSFATARNPLDLTTQPIWEPDLMEVGTKGLLDDPNNGSLTISIPCGNPQAAVTYIQGVVNAMQGSTKPLIFSALGDGAPLPTEFTKIAKDNGIIVMTTAERAMRATAALTQHGRRLAVPRATGKPQPIPGLPAMGHGTLPEYLGKEVLKAAGIAVPAGGLAKTVEDAVAMAKKIGYPVVMKAQAGQLAHKTEAGGVLLNIADEAAVRAGWTTLINNVQKAKPGITIDGMLVEKMAGRGLELVVGAKRDPKWGPVVLIGLGGIFVEALGDVRLLPADLPESAIEAELDQLQARKLLEGFRGSPAVDKKAVAKVAATIGRLMLTQPEIMEIDVNPLVATAEGVFALDALIITE